MLKKNYIPSLNGIRALSIIMVVLFHLRAGHFYDFQNPLARQLGLIFINGELGVNIFFIISGYLITTLLIQERESNGNVSLLNFYIKRTFRIFPAYYALLLVYVLLQSAGYLHLSRITWLSLLTYTKQFFSHDVHEVGHIWSLCVEELFYLVYPILFVKFYKHIRRLILALIPLFVLFRFQTFHLPASEYKNSIFVSGDSLLVGCFFAFESDAIQSFINRYKRLSLAAFPLLFLSVVSFLFLSSVHSYHTAANSSLLLKLAYALFGNVGLITNVLIAFIVLFSIQVCNAWRLFLNTKAMNYIGLLSYSIYLWQQLFTSDRLYLHKMGMTMALLLVFAAAAFSYYLIEVPFLKMREAFLRKMNISAIPANASADFIA